MTGKPKESRLVIICGPTASGKSTLALEAARLMHSEVICADSRTLYRGMDIGTAKPAVTPHGDNVSLDQFVLVEGVPHYLLDCLDPDESFSAADFQKQAAAIISHLHERGIVPIVAGGTGLYIKALVDGYVMPPGGYDQALRQKLEVKPLTELVQLLGRSDPAALTRIDLRNKRRVVRALEICLLTGQPVSQQRQAAGSSWDILQIGVEVPREELYRRIDERVDAMIANGLLIEVTRLAEKYSWDLPALSGIGYKQCRTYLRGEISLPEAISMIKRDTRHYAKRQLTWFRRDERIFWLPPDQVVANILRWLGGS